MVTYPDLRKVMGRLIEEELVTADEADRYLSQGFADHAADESPPWFVRLLVGGAAWLAALLLLAFFSLLSMISTGAFAPLGIAIAVGAVLLRRAQDRITLPRGVGADFWNQLALLGSFLARLLLAIGVWNVLDSYRAAAAALLVLEVVFLAFYPDALQRFLVPVAAGAWLMVLVLEQPIPGAREAVVVVAAALTGLVWLGQLELLEGHFRDCQQPVGYGLATFVCGALLVGVSLAGLWTDAPRAVWVASVGLAALLLVLVTEVLGAHGFVLASRVGLAGVAVALAFTAVSWREPGLLAAVSLMILGFHCRARLLVVLAGLFLVGFGVHFYYQMHLNLATKSGVLVGSGLLLLAAWWGLRWSDRKRLREAPVAAT